MLPCYVIHLKRAHERSVGVINEISKFTNSIFTIVPAIDVETPEKLTNFIETNKLILLNHNILKAPIACYLSHFKTLQLIYENYQNTLCKYAVIFEDDFQRIESEKPSDVLIQDVINELEQNEIDFDLCFLGSLNRPKIPKYVTPNIYKIDSSIDIFNYGTHAYLVKISNIPIILHMLKTIREGYDVQIFYASYLGILNTYVIKHDIFIQECDASYIQEIPWHVYHNAYAPGGFSFVLK